jgi:hypothetical protein
MKLLTFLFPLILLMGHAAQAQESKPPIVVMLKLDDLVRAGAAPEATVSPRWQRVTDFLEGEKIKGSYGILCDSLEGDCPGYVAWLKKLVANGWIELWHHGYYARLLPAEMKVNGRTAEYMGGSVEDQAAMFRKSLALVKEKVGVDMIAFGPPLMERRIKPWSSFLRSNWCGFMARRRA